MRQPVSRNGYAPAFWGPWPSTGRYWRVPCPNRCSGAPEDEELLGRAGHGDIAVDGSFDARSESAFSKLVWVDEDDEVELEALRMFGAQGMDAGRRLERI